MPGYPLIWGVTMYYIEDETLATIIDQAMRIPVNDPTRLDEMDDVDLGWLRESAETLLRIVEGEQRRRRKAE
jgi:hypothetical protein